MTPEEKISSLSLSIPKGKSASLGSYIPITKVENLIFISGQIPVDMDSLNNELRNWIVFSKQVNPGLKIAIKGDRDSDYKFAKDVIATMQDMNLNQFSFITNLEGKPE